MVKRFTNFLIILSVIILTIAIFSKNNSTKEVQNLAQVNVQPAIYNLENSKSITYYNNIPQINKNSSVNVLLLGLDGLAGDNRPRCDGIHMLSYLEEENKVVITSVPRGTYINLPGVASESAYISNACHYKGIDYGISEIEKITGIHADYIVKVGFSQAAGIFRLLNIPTTSTLQFLRNRRTNLGDFQRSHNQALFIKDMIINYFDSFMSYSNTLKYIAFTLVDTNINYNQAQDLLEKIQESGLYKNPDNIILTVKPAPNYILSDTHYNFSQSNTNQDQEYQDYQNQIKSLIENIIQNANYQTVSTAFNQKLWEQVENEQQRNEYHFQFLRLYVLSSPNPKDKTRLVKDFIEQMEVYEDMETLQKSQQLLDQINN